LKIAVSSRGKTLDAQLDPRFGRCPYFVLVNSDTLHFEVLENLGAEAMGGAGIQAAQSLVDKEVQAVIAGNVGPKAYQTLSAAGVEITVGASGTVRDAILEFNRGSLIKLEKPTVPGHFGLSKR
jgi:predicted Fe-Mo cluster-binding NifX family protein